MNLATLKRIAKDYTWKIVRHYYAPDKICPEKIKGERNCVYQDSVKLGFSFLNTPDKISYLYFRSANQYCFYCPDESLNVFYVSVTLDDTPFSEKSPIMQYKLEKII